jgi:hypothetical protein
VAEIAERTLLPGSGACKLPEVIAGQADVSPAKRRHVHDRGEHQIDA